MKVTEDERDRVVLAERARALARVPATPRDGEELLVVEFSVGDEDLCIDAAHVREVVRLRYLTPVPGVPAAVRGVTTYRGEILAAVDVRPALGRPASGPSEIPWLLVLGSAKPELGLVASHVRGVASMGVPALGPLPGEVPPGARRFARGVTDRAVTVLDGAALLDDPAIFAPRDDTPAGPADDSERGGHR